MVQAVVLHSQYVSPDIRQYSMEEGMPMRSVYGGCQDSSGIVWFSGTRGMVSYDGIRFKTYNPDSTNTVSYTHLDVYKRQTKHSGLHRGA